MVPVISTLFAGEPPTFVATDSTDEALDPYVRTLVLVSSPTGQVLRTITTGLDPTNPSFAVVDNNKVEYLSENLSPKTGLTGQEDIVTSDVAGGTRSRQLTAPGCPVVLAPSVVTSPNGGLVLWPYASCSSTAEEAEALDVIDMSNGAVGAVSGRTGFDPISWGGPGARFLAGYQDSSCDCHVALARLDNAGRIGRLVLVPSPNPGCYLASPAFVPMTKQLSAIEYCDPNQTSTRAVLIDPLKARVTSTLFWFPHGFQVPALSFDASGTWAIFDENSGGNTLGTPGGNRIFIEHSQRIFAIPWHRELANPQWR